MRFFAAATRGAEEILAAELQELALPEVQLHRGGVSFGSSLEDGYRACVGSRTASRVLLPLAEFEVHHANDLYNRVIELPWTEHLGAEATMAVNVAGSQSPAGPSHFVALKTKDAVVDRIREDEGDRPSIDKVRPGVRLHVHVRGPRTTVSIDLAGSGLHERGGGAKGAVAPLKENLAAVLLRLAGWHQKHATHPLYDPMCGSGTLLVEAASMALDIAPGLTRMRFGAEGWRAHDKGLWQRLLDESQERREASRKNLFRIAGSDVSPAALDIARERITRAGLSAKVRVSRGELRDAKPPWDDPGILITNPPYGERLGEAGELGPLYEGLGDVLKQRFAGWTAFVLSGNRALDKRVGLRPARRHVLYNGPIDCRLLEYPITEPAAPQSKGPGWRKASDEARGFRKRLEANLRERRDWAKRAGVTAYRIYDSDVPTYNLSVDWYASGVRVEEYSRPKKVDPAAADRRLKDAVQVVAEVLEIDPAEIVLRVRHKRGPHDQAMRYGDRSRFSQVEEHGMRFVVNIHDYLDTGLFLDDRLLRQRIREQAKGCSFLNLFAYTCAATVAAATGGAGHSVSVDLSNVYLTWGRQNMELNGFKDRDQHTLLRGDALRFLQTDRRGGYDLIFLAPPSYSKSKGMDGDLDVQRDHRKLLRMSADHLNREGEILFSTNYRDFELDELDGLDATEITPEVTPKDFARRPRLRAWSVTRR